ncbi:MAG: hypothetical protein AB7E55_04560 [Pigmentiphaga sp.]
MPTDKMAHLVLGVLIAGAVMVLPGPLWAFTVLMLAAAGKELVDLRVHGRPDVWDAVATIAGGLIVIGAALVL